MKTDDDGRRVERWTRIAGAVAAFLVCAVLVVVSLRNARQHARLSAGAPTAADTAIDPALLRYRETARVATGLRRACGIAVGPTGMLYAAGDRTVLSFDAQGKSDAVIKLDAAPTAVAVTADGALLVAMTTRMAVYAPDRTRRAQWNAPGTKAYITSLAAAGNDIWVADAGQRVVYHYHRTGKLLGRLGEKDDARRAPGLVAPGPYLDVAVAGNTVWVADTGRHRLEAYTWDGRLVSTWGKAGAATADFTGCCNPAAFALLPDGRFVTAEKGVRRVKVYRHDGTLESVVAGPDAFNTDGGGPDVAVDPQGRIYVLDPTDGIVHVFEKKSSN